MIARCKPKPPAAPPKMVKKKLAAPDGTLDEWLKSRKTGKKLIGRKQNGQEEPPQRAGSSTDAQRPPENTGAATQDQGPEDQQGSPSAQT